MLHTNRESYRLTSLQQQWPESSGQVDNPLTLKEQTLTSIKERKDLEDAQKVEVDKFLKGISFSNGNIRQTISPAQKTILDSMLATLKIQKKENEILDTNVIRQKLGIQQETRQALAVAKTWNPEVATDKLLAKGMAESVNPELAELKLFLIENGYLDTKYKNTQIRYGNETVAAIKKYNEANPKNSLWSNPEEVSVKRVRELKDVQVIKSSLAAQPKAPEQKETPSAIVAKRVHKWADGKLPDISDAEKKATKNLQVALTTLWLYVGKDDSIFGQATEDAVKKFLASPDLRGNIPANTNPQEVTQVIITRIEEAATKAQRIAAAPQDPVSIVKPQRRPSQTPSDGNQVRKTNNALKWDNNPSRLASEVVKDLETVNFFLDAHNRTYGERDSLISNRNGIVWVVWQLSNPDSRRLAWELGMSEDRIKAYGDSLGLDNSKVTDGLIRMALIAVVSWLLSWGASVALEILWINVSKDYKKWPEMKKILELMGRKGDITSKRRDVLMDPRTTSKDVEAVGKAMRGKNLLPNNIRADVKKILSSDFFLFDIIADIFWNSQKKQMNALIDQFEKARNLDEAEFILTQIVQIATEEYYKKYPTWSTNNILDSLADSLKAIRDLKAKKDKIEWKGFDKKRYEKETGTIQAILDATYGKPEPHKWFKKGEMKLSSAQSYAPALPKNLNPATLWDMLQKMANTIIPGDKYTMLANLMRWVNYHTGISFKPDEFLVAFQNTRWLNNNERKAINKSILSNTGRQRNQQFNGINPADSIAVMELNGQKVYFKGACTNVLPNIEDINTVIEVSSSIPVAIPVPTWVATGTWLGSYWTRWVERTPNITGNVWPATTWTTSWWATWWVSTTLSNTLWL
jgi:hypothetical protein